MDPNNGDMTDPLKESEEDSAVRMGVLGGVSQRVSSRQQGNETGHCALCSRGDVKEKRPAVQLRKEN